MNTYVAIAAYNRPDYFRRVLNSLAPQAREFGAPLFVFLDRGDKDAEMRAICAAHGIDAEHIVGTERRLGCGRNIIRMRSVMFAEHPCDRLLVAEDDMVPGPTYLRYCSNLLDWAEARFDNVGAVQGWNKCLLPLPEKLAAAGKVHVCAPHWWAYLLTRGAWERIAGRMAHYVKHFIAGNYGERNNAAVRQWTKKLVDIMPEPGPNNCPAPNWREKIRKWGHSPTNATGQDGLTEATFAAAGLVRLAPVVNRGLYIGMNGTHGTAANFKRCEFDKVALDEMPDDAERKEFELI